MNIETQRQLKGLNYKIRSIKGSITKFSTYLEQINEDTFDAIQINTRLAKIKEFWSQYFDIQMQIESIRENESEDSDDGGFEEDYFNSIARAEKLLASHSRTVSGPNTNTRVNHNVSHDIQPQVRLPQIELPSFSGALEEWIPFYETFGSLIHLNETLSNVQRFHYLKSCLKGEAANCIQELQISTNNYDVAWATLKDRFDNTRLIIKKHIQGIHELPSCMNENVVTLRQILDGTQKHTRALKALERPVEHWSDLLVYLITSKLDKVTNKEWESSITSKYIPDFKELLEFLSHKCNTLEAITKSSSCVSPNIRLTKPQKSFVHFTREEIQCSVCNANHFLYQCSKFLNMSVEDRVNQVKTSNLCLNCLRAGHQSKNCNSSRCKKCHYKHNTLLHPIEGRVSEPIASTSNDRETTRESSNPLAVHISNVHFQPQVLLPTAVVNIADRKGKLYQCRALLDSGSQSNFISRALSRKLQLNQEPVNVPISGIGQASTSIKAETSTKIKSRYNNFNVALKCLVLDNITNYMPSAIINRKNMNIPRNVKLADPKFDHSNRIDLLIGAELFWQLLCVGQLRVSNTNLIMQITRIGWIISGSINSKSPPASSTCNLAIQGSLELKQPELTPEYSQCLNEYNDLSHMPMIHQIEVQQLAPKVSWNETLPAYIHTECLQYQNSLSYLNSIKISRNVMPHKANIELHGFPDASEKAYRACVCVRTTNETGETTSELLSSKSRVVLVKHTTIPRFELSAALLLAQLMNKVTQAIGVTINRKRYSTDTTITLAMINTTERQLQTFVANRVGEIQHITNTSDWYHVSGGENPADLLSREILPQELSQSILWWRGPEWLANDWPSSSIKLEHIEVPEKRNICLKSNVLYNNSQCSYDEKHSIIAPSKHRFIKLLIRQVHYSEFQAGMQVTLAKNRSIYWHLSGRKTVRGVLNNCITCFKSKPVFNQPIMGNLPIPRVKPTRPFVNVGVDYSGPFLTRNSLSRRAYSSKSYVALFICMAVKAVHLELVPSLDSNSFINALKRFIARRGMVTNIYSDNGTNFVKSNKELKQLHKMFHTTTEVEKIVSVLSYQGIFYHFTPARAPHFGGLWEAAVKSIKYHFKHIIGITLLIYKEFIRVASQILNSGPLIPSSKDPTPPDPVLTPGHFLIEDLVRSNLDPTLLALKPNRLSRFQSLERLKQHFGNGWSSDYRQQLQEQPSGRGQQVQIGQLVMLREAKVPPMLWPPGRTTMVHLGTDGVIQAAISRPCAVKVEDLLPSCVLPIDTFQCLRTFRKRKLSRRAACCVTNIVIRRR